LTQIISDIGLKKITMKREILSGTNMIIHFIQIANSNLTEDVIQNLHNIITQLLTQKYERHWNFFNPNQGSAYRCIRINNTMDPVIIQAAKLSKIPINTIKLSLPPELTIWMDPRLVSYRIGETGSIGILYKYKNGCTEWRP
jgi:protein Tob/BTG